LHTHIHSSIHNSQEVEAAHVAIER
jgi:hypothetical protein